ncbi:MAG: hypothetical protein HYY06_28715 [Deltaproteobacteria bacterium]|nr:hypothetical protein [Deltaproteobacteria bacterium]
MRFRLIVAGILLGACALPEAPTERSMGSVDAEACEATDPRAVEVTVNAQPDTGPGPLVDLVRSARASIDLSVYLIGTNNDVYDALVEKAAEVDVRVIVDGRSTRQRTLDALVRAGARARTQPEEFVYVRYGPFYHPKFAVVDRQRAWVSTSNLLEPYMSSERNFDAFDDDPEDVADLQEIFDADWEDRSPDVDCTRLVVSPDNSRERILAFIDGAASSLLVESMQLADRRVREHLAARAAEGVEVRVILANACWIWDNIDAATFLAGAGISARWMSEYDAHVKMMVADGRTAYLGSVNMSRNSIDRNREVGLILDDPPALEVMATTFEHDWSVAGADWSAFPEVCR